MAPPPGHVHVRRHVRLTRTILLWLILVLVSFVYYRMLSRVRSSLPLVSAPGIAAVAGGGNGGDSESKERGQVRKRVPEKDDFAPGRPRPGRAVPSKRAPLPAKPLDDSEKLRTRVQEILRDSGELVASEDDAQHDENEDEDVLNLDVASVDVDEDTARGRRHDDDVENEEEQEEQELEQDDADAQENDDVVDLTPRSNSPPKRESSWGPPARKKKRTPSLGDFSFEDSADETPTVTLRSTNHEWPTHAWGKGGKGSDSKPTPKNVDEVAGLVLSDELAYPGVDLVVTKQNFKKLKKGDHIQNLRNIPETSPYEATPGACANGAEDCPRRERRREVRPFRSCALVGNSGAVRSAPFGESIDKHDLILRINQAPVPSYERYVGSRTDLRLLNRKWVSLFTSADDGRKTLLPNEQVNSTLLVSRVSSAEFEHLASLVRKQRPDVGVSYMANGAVTRSRWMLSAYREAMGALENSAQRVVYRGGDVPSSGFIGFYFLMQACERIAVYGLCVERASSKTYRTFSYHYFSNYLDSTQLRAHPHHSFQAEGELVQLIQRVGRLAKDLSTGATALRATDVRLCIGPANLTREEKIELATCGVHDDATTA